jgi:hypothetical protein
MDGRFYKGVLWIMGNASHVTREFSDITEYFWLISTSSGSAQWAKGRDEDIHGLTLSAYEHDYETAVPEGRSMVIRNADFIDENDFYPIELEKKYDLFFNSTLWKFKRHELFLSTLYDLKRRYRRELKAAVILWSGPPRLQNSQIYSKSFYRVACPLVADTEARRYARHVRGLYKDAIRDGLCIDVIKPMYRWKTGTVSTLRRLYSESKIYVLLSQTEGVNRAAKEALLCDVPVLVIEGSTTAAEFVNTETGEAVPDNQQAISDAILDMLAHGGRYAPRQWVVKNHSRTRICEEVWRKINALEQYPGYPDISVANTIRHQFTAREYDDYLALNDWKGVGSRGSLQKEMRAVRKTIGLPLCLSEKSQRLVSGRAHP